MKIEKETFLIYSIVILILGWLYFSTVSYLHYVEFAEEYRQKLLVLIPKRRKYDTIWFKSIAVGLGVISLYLSYKSEPLKKIYFRTLIISLSILLIAMSII